MRSLSDFKLTMHTEADNYIARLNDQQYYAKTLNYHFQLLNYNLRQLMDFERPR